jgi:hypothetical protein
MSPTPPPSIERDLALYDPRLRLRWGPHTALWYLERKMDARHPQLEKERPNPGGTSPRWRDIWPGWKDGYAVVMAIHPSRCTTRIILEALRSTDLHALGGTDALNRRLDAIQEEEDKRLDRELDTFVEAGSRELFDRCQWVGKRKIQVPNDDVTVERITPVIQHEGFTVLDRRVTV